MRRLWLLLTVLVGALGCSKSPVSLQSQLLGTGAPVDQPAAAAGNTSRAPRRLSLAQLRASFPVAMGNDQNGQPITWQANLGPAPQPGLDAFARTLGEADFINLTADNLDPSPIYVKFMDDAARSVCDQAWTSDLAQADATKRVLLRYVSATDTPTTNPSGFNQDLAYLKLRLHGIKVTDDSQLTPLLTLFNAAGAGSPTPVADGWRAVCVSLVTAPEFHLY